MLVSEFLTNLKKRGQYQNAQTVLTDADFIQFANDELRTVICPKILSLRDNFFAGQREYTLGPRRYRMPTRILGSRISKVTIINGSEQYHLNQMPNTDKSTSFRRGFYMSEGDLVITGQMPTGIMRVVYPIRPPKMSTTAASMGTVTSVATSLFNANPVIGAIYEVIRSSSPFRTITPNASVTNGGTGTDNDSTDYERFQIGDILINPDSTHIVPLEQQLCDWLLQRTHMRVLQALGQTDELQSAGAKLADMQKDAMALMTPRVQDSPKTIFGGELTGWNWRE